MVKTVVLLMGTSVSTEKWGRSSVAAGMTAMSQVSSLFVECGAPLPLPKVAATAGSASRRRARYVTVLFMNSSYLRVAFLRPQGRRIVLTNARLQLLF